MARAITTIACANCGRVTAPLEAHAANDVTTRASALCPACWFDAGKE